MVEPHVNYQSCCEADRVGLKWGNELVSFPCSKCETVYCDPVEYAIKLHAQHRFMLYGHKWSKYPLVQGSPLTILGCQMRDSTLFVLKFPVDS